MRKDAEISLFLPVNENCCVQKNLLQTYANKLLLLHASMLRKKRLKVKLFDFN